VWWGRAPAVVVGVVLCDVSMLAGWLVGVAGWNAEGLVRWLCCVCVVWLSWPGDVWGFGMLLGPERTPVLGCVLGGWPGP
jgi:hypothetical protein